MSSDKFVIRAGWKHLNEFTSARIALGRAGNSLPTDEVLRFGLAHAQTRDAVHTPLDVELLLAQLRAESFQVQRVSSRAADRATYLQRPDLGRQLNIEHELQLSRTPKHSEIGIVIVDGLSSRAIQDHAVPLLCEMREQFALDLHQSTVVVATQGRVALGDAIAQAMKQELVIVLIGERPGLSSPDSLGAYITYKPYVGCSDAERNCVSNIRPQGLPYKQAAHKIKWLCETALQRKLSGVALKDESDQCAIEYHTGSVLAGYENDLPRESLEPVH